MGRPLVKAAGIAGGTLCIAIGLAAQLGGADLLGPSAQGHTVSQPPPAQPSAPASPSAQPTPQVQSVTAAGTIYSGWQGGGKKKHGKG